MAANISNQGLAWSGRYLVNPFDPANDGSLVDLAAYPGLAAYLAAHADKLRGRHVARTRPATWYRTIDRIWPALQCVPKLVIPDIQVGATIGLDDGRFYPHHNVYYVTSATWELRALKALLRSSLVLQQVRAYSVQMRGGAVRFQAQTLRRVRVPALSSLSAALVRQLADVAESDDQTALDGLAGEAFAT